MTGAMKTEKTPAFTVETVQRGVDRAAA